MNCELQISAYHGDNSGLNYVRLVSKEKLDVGNMPNLTEVKQVLKDYCTESWAHISLNEYDDYYDDDEEDNEEQEKEVSDKLKNEIKVGFHSEYGGGDALRAKFSDLQNNLSNLVTVGKYIEKIYHGKDKVKFVYYLDASLFKSINGYERF